MEFFSTFAPFFLAVIFVVINGVPQLAYAAARGFLLKPTAFAYFVGAIGNALTGSVTPIAGQAETITIASIKKNVRNNISALIFAAIIMMILALFGGVSAIAAFAGDAVVLGMMSGVGLILASVAWDMFEQEKRTAAVSIISALITYALTLDSPNKVVYTIAVSVLVSTIDFVFIQKKRVDLNAAAKEDGRIIENVMSDNGKFWTKEFWAEFKIIKPAFSRDALFGALSLMCINIGANTAFGNITASIANTTQNLDHLTFINSLADIPSALFGGAPIEAIISGTAGSPFPVAAGIVMMIVTGALLFAGLVGKISKYLPSQSIAGFLLAIGFFLTFLPNLSAVSVGVNPVQGYAALGVTIWSKNPFLGMAAGIGVRYIGIFFGL